MAAFRGTEKQPLIAQVGARHEVNRTLSQRGHPPVSYTHLYDVSIGESTNILSYADFASISEYAIPAMQWACGSGIVTGVTDSTLAPQGTATRAQCAAMLMRFVEL